MNESRKWEVIRQDDNGSVFVIQENFTQIEAESLVEEYTAKGHKQTCWSEEKFPVENRTSNTTQNEN